MEFEILDPNDDLYILWRLYHSINVLYKNKYFFKNSNKTKKLKIRKYKETCSMYGLRHLINYPSRVTCNSVTLTDHILTNMQNNILQSGVIHASISDHSMISCITKIPKSKIKKTKGITFLVNSKITQLISIKRPWKELSFQIMKTLMTLT